MNSDEHLKEEHNKHELYPGDLGKLPEDARRALVQLLSGPLIDGNRHSKLWSVLIRHQDNIRSRLSELFLELIIDHDLEVAFTRQADTDTADFDAPKLLRRSPLTFLDTVLILYLRQLLTEADLQGDRAVVSNVEMIEQMKLYEKSKSTDQAGFEKRINAAIEKARKNTILNLIKGSEDRYEISPTLKLLFNAEEISALTKIYTTYENHSSENFS
jgi:uncharacterized protein DUF4194